MNEVADAALAKGGKVIGVLPRFMSAKELAHESLTELHLVDTMHQRKQLMAELANGFVALPGGFGTFEEIFEALTWSQLHIHRSPCALLNVAGYYDSLIEFPRQRGDGGICPAGFAGLVDRGQQCQRVIRGICQPSPGAAVKSGFPRKF
jgi:uncharacterized protein (TIGR00730 family)